MNDLSITARNNNTGFDINRIKSSRRNISLGSSIGLKSDYESKKQSPPVSRGFRKHNFSSQGEQILEKKLQISKDEQDYYSNKRVYSNISPDLEKKVPVELTRY